MENPLENPIVAQDLDYIYHALAKDRQKFRDSSILITGAAGFLGYYFMLFFARFASDLGIKNIIALDNFMLHNKPKWLEFLAQDSRIKVQKFDIIKDSISRVKNAQNADFILHLASIASPSFYRKYPLETLDANIWGLRNLLDFYANRAIKGFLFFSSSEIYGDAKIVPTDESYRGNVACIGPRACYDEAKRFGETMCEIFAQKFDMKIAIVRPFNNYGAGMNLNDKRVPADFAKAVLENRDIEILSNGAPKRTFCYISDAILGYLKALTHGRFEYFNIGIDTPEISIKELAQIYQSTAHRLFGYQGKVKFATSSDKNYLKDNPQRRCPNIAKARDLLGYNPQILVRDGVERFLRYLAYEARIEVKQ